MRRISPPQPPSIGSGEAVGQPSFGTNGTDYLQIRDYVRILARRRWLIAGIVAAGLAAGVVHNWRATPIFEARATVQIDVDPNVLALDRQILDQRDWLREFVPTQLGILQSRELARMAREDLERSHKGLQAQERAARIPTVGAIVGGRTVVVTKDSRLLNVGYRSSDPVLAADVANALARAYVQQAVAFRRQTSGDASDWLTKQVEHQRKLVETSEAALQRYRQQHSAEALITDQMGEQRQYIVVQKLADLQRSVTDARQVTIEKEAQYKQLLAIQSDHDAPDTLSAIASNAVILGLKTELTGLQRQLVQASEELGERHPDMIRLQAAVQDAERKLQIEISKIAEGIRNDLEAARTRERALTAALERQKGEVRALNAKAGEYTALEREAAMNRELLDKLLQRSGEASLARNLQTSNVRIVDRAEVPTAPVSPRKERTLMLAAVGSGTFALGLVFVLEIFNRRLSSPDDVKRHLGVTVLGVAPQVEAGNGQVSLLLGDGAPPEFAEHLHGIRTNLLLAPGLAEGRTLLVTSSEPGEGKTVAAANLAVSFSRLNQRVLLIDADLRKPRLHEVFGVEQQPGLTDVLSEKAAHDAFWKTKRDRLWVMPAGSLAANPADLLGSERFAKLIEVLRAQFDWIVIDSPPVLAVTDPCLIARVASGVLFVVGCGQASRDAGAAAVERLDAVGANLVGALLNRAPLNGDGDSYLPYSYHSYRSYYALPERADSLTTRDVSGVS